MGKDLMSQDELAVMDNSKCILQLRGERPFLSDKYDITKHPGYRLLSDLDPTKAFNIEAEMHTTFRMGSERVASIYEMGNFVES
jgi:type IV secretion system protein VirD4